MEMHMVHRLHAGFMVASVAYAYMLDNAACVEIRDKFGKI